MIYDLSERAIKTSNEGLVTYCKFITSNDTGTTGAHQAGYHIHKSAWSLMFDNPGKKGTIRDKFVRIKWQDDFETDSRFVYYGTGTRNEYRLTRFGRGFPFLGDGDTGSLLVLSKIADDFYKAYVLATEEEIENYLNFFNIPPDKANGLIPKLTEIPANLQSMIETYVKSLSGNFPTTTELALKAREIFFDINQQSDQAAVLAPDSLLTDWIDTEYTLFRAVEKQHYKSELTSPFDDINRLVEFANTVLNRRKSRAGKSLESHLAKIFDMNRLSYTLQGVTEGRRKPDFIIPGIEMYHDDKYSDSKLIFLGAKTTCKDRWRQVLNEAARVPHKHLFTLQQGISSHQLQEMKDENLTLVVPEKHLVTFPAEHRRDIMTLKNFISQAKTIIQNADSTSL